MTAGKSVLLGTLFLAEVALAKVAARPVSHKSPAQGHGESVLLGTHVLQTGQERNSQTEAWLFGEMPSAVESASEKRADDLDQQHHWGPKGLSA